MPTQPLLNRYARFWGIVVIVSLFAIWLFQAVLMPFVVAIIAAYALDPLCDALERKGMSRTLGVSLVTTIFVFLVALFLMLAIPALISQFLSLIQSAPEIFAAAQQRLFGYFSALTSFLPDGLFEDEASDIPRQTSITSIWETIRLMLGEEAFGQISARLAQTAGSLFQVVLSLARTVWSGSLAVINAISLVFVTPFVTFYLLRDWDKMTASIYNLIPFTKRDEMSILAKQIDSTLAGFMRGQSIVVMIMSLFYCTALAFIGLDFWLLVGLTTGLFSFIPFVGAIVGFVLSVGLALFQFDTLTPIILTLAVFFVGQFLEGNILTPKFVGGRVGLHPAWIMFALLAGGSVFGFLGILVAVPVASMLGVLIRFFVQKYRDSAFFGDDLDVLPSLSPNDEPVFDVEDLAKLDGVAESEIGKAS